MKMEEQEDLGSRMLSSEEEPHVHHHHQHQHQHQHQHYYGDARGGDYAGDLHFHRGMYPASSSSWGQNEGFPGNEIGDGISGRAHGLSPLSPSQLPPSIQLGSPSLSFEESRVGRLDERVLQESIFVDRFRDFNLGSDPRVPNPSGIGPAFALSLVNSSAGPSLSQSNRPLLGYAAYANHSLPNSLLFDEDETTSSNTLQQPWPANSSYGATESGWDNGDLGRHSQNSQSLGVGYSSSMDPPYSIYTAGLNSRNNGGQQLRSPRSREAFGLEPQSIIGHASMSYAWNESLSPRNRDGALWLDGLKVVTCGKNCIFRKATNRYDSLFLVEDLSKGKEHVTFIYKCAIHHFIVLMANDVGNHLMKKLFGVCSQTQLMQFILVLTEKSDVLIEISRNSYGIKSLQKLIECIKNRELIATFTEALQPVIIVLIRDVKGRHVITKCLECFTPEDNKYIFEAAAKNCLELATDRHSCSILQNCIAMGTVADKQKLLAEISAHAYEIAQDPHGNYVIQYILGLDIPSANQALASEFKGKYVELSTHKFGSNVVEKCLEKYDKAEQATIILELISVPRFDQLMEHQFANYVISTALIKAKDSDIYEMLQKAVLRHEDNLKTNPCCSRIFSRPLLNRRFPIFKPEGFIWL